MDDPPVKIFVMGDNVWRTENEWPLARTEFTPYYLHSAGKANTLNGDGSLSPNRQVPNSQTSSSTTPMTPHRRWEATTLSSPVASTTKPLQRNAVTCSATPASS